MFTERLEIDYGVDKICGNLAEKIVWGVNRTPDNFQTPDALVIGEVLSAVKGYISVIKEKEIII